MHQDVCLVKLTGGNNFAVITPGRVAYGLNASAAELRNFLQEEEALFLHRRMKNARAHQSSSVSLGVIPTFDCNLDCVYCYARGGESKEILPLEIGKAAIRGAASPQNRKRLKVSLVGGGEPLLYLTRVKELATYAKALYQHVELNVVTNGTFGEDALKWLLKNRVSVRVSYDGVRQNIQRPFANGKPSRKVVEQNIRRLIQGGAFVIGQCVVTKAGLGTMRRTVDVAVSLGLRAIKFEPALATAVSRATERLEPDPKKYALALLDVIKYIAERGYDLTVDTGYFAEPSTEYYCGMAGNNRVVTPQGLVTACVEVARPGDPYTENVIVGCVKKGRMVTSTKKRGWLQTLHYDNQIGGCSKCNLRLICHGGCPMANIWRGGLPLRKSKFTCVVEHTLLPPLLLKIAEDARVANVVIENGTIDRF